ncbi:MAG: TonB-dependent receptor, partial [Novosphingobium sp.]
QIDAQTVCLATGTQVNSLGRVGLSLTETYFRDRAIYWQGIYELTDQIKLTGGIRYTWDTMRSGFQVINLRYYNSTSSVVTNNGFGTINNVFSTGFNGRTLLVPTMANPAFSQGAGFCNNNVAFGYPANIQSSAIPAYDSGSAANAYFPAQDAQTKCRESHTVKTSAPTWLLGLDYKPSNDILLYGKYSRGYRQGGVIAFALDQVQDYDKEKVDTFEIGAKTSWQGSMPGYFNIAAFHNNFSNQQLQIGISCNPVANCPQTTAVLNVGKSRLQGLEIEAGISPFEGFRLEASYAYLKTRIIDLIDPTSFVLARNATLLGLDVRPLPIGSVIPNAQPHKLVLSASYRLPLDASIGKITFGATGVYSSAYRAVADPGAIQPGSCVNLGVAIPGAPATGPLTSRFVPATFGTNTNSVACSAVKPDVYASSYGVLPSSKVLNININWENVGGLPVDAAFFMTNVTKERTYLHANVQTSNTGGFLSDIIGEPQMFGFRLKMKFGS